MDEHDFISILDPEILKEAKIEKDGHSWIAAEIQVIYSVAVE